MIEDLSNYRNYPKTSSCFLDGRYFNEVFHKYPGLIVKPLNIFLITDNIKYNGKVEYQSYMNPVTLDQSYPNLLRVIITTQDKQGKIYSRHSNLVIIDWTNNKVYRFEPSPEKSIYHDQINQIIQEYLGKYLTFEMYELENPLQKAEINPVCVEARFKSGYCVAYIIKYAHDYLTGRQYNPSHIRRFSALIEKKYGPLDPREADIEYGLFGEGDRTGPTLLGGLGGAAVGGILTGSAGGALLGGIGGGLLGYGLSGR